MRSKKPRPGHVWFDNDGSEEIILIVRKVSKGEGRLVPGCECWELLVTRQDGSVYLDWESLDGVHDWYTDFEPREFFTRVV